MCKSLQVCREDGYKHHPQGFLERGPAGSQSLKATCDTLYWRKTWHEQNEKKAYLCPPQDPNADLLTVLLAPQEFRSEFMLHQFMLHGLHVVHIYWNLCLIQPAFWLMYVYLCLPLRVLSIKQEASQDLGKDSGQNTQISYTNEYQSLLCHDYKAVFPLW